VKQIIAVASGKGGVGKSTIAVNLAFACAQAGARVGILDIDVYGPSVPGMLGLREHRLIGGQQGVLEPVKAHGLEIMSMGFLTTKETPVVWRGPIASQLVQQFLGMVAWGELDYLFVDLPPGTGDIQLTLTQSVPLSGVLIVTTPQVVAHTIAEKGLRMFQQVKVPILGIIENMAYYHCPECDHHDPIFREGGGEAVAKAMDLPLLARIRSTPASPQLWTLASRSRRAKSVMPSGHLRAKRWRVLPQRRWVKPSTLPHRRSWQSPRRRSAGEVA
jgi:ATP-binding protein involved in chromosome partitioning